MISALQLCLIFSLTLFTYTHAHGALIYPPSRNSRAQFNEYLGTDWQSGSSGTTRFFIGGWESSDVTSVCGAPAWDAPSTIGATFTAGQTIEIQMAITAPHAGYHEFRLCSYAPTTKSSMISCFLPGTENRLRRVNALPAGSTVAYPGPVPTWTSDDLATRWRAPSLNSASPLDQTSQDGTFTGNYFKNFPIYKLSYKLPAGVTCSNCILQWFYQSSNSAGTGANALNLVQGERFWNCADITITGGSSSSSSSSGSVVTNPVTTTPSGSGSSTRCGAGWANAATKCGTTCTSDAQCPSGETCFGQLPVAPCAVASKVRCGAGWANAAGKCGTTCTTDAQCPSGETCFGQLPVAACTGGSAATSDDDAFATAEYYSAESDGSDSSDDDNSDDDNSDDDNSDDDSSDDSESSDNSESSDDSESTESDSAQAFSEMAVADSTTASAPTQNLGGIYIALIVIGALCLAMTLLVIVTLLILYGKINN